MWVFVYIQEPKTLSSGGLESSKIAFGWAGDPRLKLDTSLVLNNMRVFTFSIQITDSSTHKYNEQ